MRNLVRYNTDNFLTSKSSIGRRKNDSYLSKKNVGKYVFLELSVNSTKQFDGGFIKSDFYCVSNPLNEINITKKQFDFLAKLNSFKELSHNWDGLDSPQPKSFLIDISIEILRILNERSIKVSNAYPLGDGGVQLDIDLKKFQYEIEIEEYNINILKFDNDNNLIKQILIDKNHLNEIINVF